MSIGFAILHANRIPIGLEDPHSGAIAADEGIDVGLGVLALHQPEALLQEFFAGMLARVQALVGELQQAFGSPVGLFNDLRRWIDELGQLRFDEFRLTPWVDRLADLLGALAPAGLIERADAFLQRLAVALPGLAGGSLIEGVLEVVFAGLDVLERPRLEGRSDLAAHRGHRLARIIRIWLDSALQPLREQVRGLDPIGWLRARLTEFSAALEAGAGGMLRQVGEQLRTRLRPLTLAVDALLALRVSVSVDVEVHNLPGQGELWIDDYQVTPHDWKHPLWWTDLASNIASLVHGIIDLQRFNPFYGPRAGDATLGVIGLAWQAARTLVRALRPDFLCTEDWTRPGAFWFSELGDFCIQTLLRLLGSLHEVTDAGSNFVMSIACRLARWFTFSLQPRLPYLLARSIWYLRKWLEQGWIEEHVVAAGETIESIASARTIDPAQLRRWNRLASDEQPAVGKKLTIVSDPLGERPGRVRAPMSFSRHAWIGWCSIFVVGWIFGLIQHWRSNGWQDMQLSGFTSTDFYKSGCLWALLACAVVVGVFVPVLVAWAWPCDVKFDIDYVTLTVLLVMLVLVVVLAAVSMWSTGEIAAAGTPTFIIGLVAVVALLALPVLWSWGGWTNDGEPNLGAATAFLYGWSLVIGIGVFGAVTTLLWWIYLDDGRDKHAMFPTMDPAESKYKLPWPRGRVWICGQGFHGIFSHYARDPNNLYGYDFLEGKNEPASAARGGLVILVDQSHDYGNSSPNHITIQHLDWGRTVDPGEPEERVMTYSEYYHLAPSRAHVALDHYVVQGQNMADIDSTGRSAQHHLHFAATAGDVTIPSIFADPSLRRDRTNPIFRLIPGRGHNPGRPIAQALYESDNEVAAGPGRPIALQTTAASQGPAHTHWLAIDLADMTVDGGLGTTEFWTDVVDGHRHRVELDAAQLQALLLHRPTTLRAEAELGHEHGFEAESHDGVSGRVDSPRARLDLVAPPPGQLIARQPAPYNLLGREVVLRVDDNLTQAHLFGGDRARVVAELALGRAPRSSETLRLRRVVGLGFAALHTQVGRFGAREAATQIDDLLLGSSFTCRALPVLVLETRTRGSAASVQIEGFFGARSQTGEGPLARQEGCTGVLLAAAIAAQLAAPTLSVPNPSLLTAQLVGTEIELAYDGNPIQFAGTSRIAEVLDQQYEPSTRRIRGAGALPLGCGRLQLTWGAAGEGLEVAIHGTPARLSLDPALAWLTPAHVADAALHVALGDSERALRLPASATLDEVATTIARAHEGVRAWVQDGKLVIESVDVGPDIVLRASKAKPAAAAAGVDFSASASSAAPTPTPGAAIHDSALIERGELVGLITEALAQSSRRAGAPPLQARWVAGRLELELPGAPLGVVAAKSSADLIALLGLSNDGPNLLRSSVLSEPIELGAGGWLVLTLGGVELRVDLIGEPARIELPPIDALPDAASLRVKTESAANFSEVDLGAATSVEALARSLALATGLITRVGHRLVIEARQPGSAAFELGDAAAFGFLARAPRREPGQGASLDLHAVDASGFAAAAQLATGDLVAESGRFSVAATDRVRLTSPAGQQVQVDWLGQGPDPLGFTSSAGPTSSSESFTARALPTRALHYRVALLDAVTPTETAASFVQVAAQPAFVRALRPPAARPLVAGTTLRITIRHPRLDEVAPRELISDIDLGWVSEWFDAQRATRPEPDVQAELCTRIAEQLQREAPLLEVRRVGAHGHEARLQLETKGAGSGWNLWLDGRVAIHALGFDPDAMIDATLWVRGEGDVADQRAAKPSELEPAFSRAAARLTHSREPAHFEITTPAAPSPDQGKLSLASVGATIRVNVSPAQLQAALNPVIVGAGVEIDARVPLDLPGGQIVVEKQIGAAPAKEVAVIFVHGMRARARSQGLLPAPGSAEEAAELDWLANHPITRSLVVEVDGRARTVPSFAARPSSFQAAIAHIAASVPELCISITSARELVVESRTRGSNSQVALRFIGFDPATELAHHSLLGCNADIQDEGAGTFHDLGAVDAESLRAALRHATNTPVLARNLVSANHVAASPAHVRVSAATNVVPLVGEGVRRRDLASPGARAEAGAVIIPWSGPVALRSCLVAFGRYGYFMAPNGAQRRVVLPLWGSPARLDFIIQPASPSAFSGRRLPIVVQGHSLVVQFAASVHGWSELGPAIERAGEGRLVARVIERSVGVGPAAHLERRLVITSASEGNAMSLALGPATTSDARGLLTAQPAIVGAGSLPDLDAVEGPALASALTGGFAVADRLEAVVDMPSAPSRSYSARLLSDPELLRVRSRSSGCMSSVEPVSGTEEFRFDRSLQRGPARRAALVLEPPVGGQWTLAAAGRLALTFDGPTGGRRIEIDVPAGSYTAPALARHLHAALFVGEFGCAAAFADGSIVIETLRPGLEGHIEVDTTTTSALLRPSHDEARGWPAAAQFLQVEEDRSGAPYPNPPSPVADYLPMRGLRAHAGAPTPAIWSFSDRPPGSAGVKTAQITLQAAWDANALASALDAQLQGTPGGPIGIARRAPDGTLHIEASAGGWLHLQIQEVVAGAPVGVLAKVGVVASTRVGVRTDLASTPGLELRPSDTLRTFRLVYDRKGEGNASVASDFVDAGWLRVATDTDWGVARIEPSFNPPAQRFARGRYLLAARAEAAKFDYQVPGPSIERPAEMIASVGSATLDGEVVPVVRVARYWIGLRRLGSPALMVGVRNFAGEVLVDWLIG